MRQTINGTELRRMMISAAASIEIHKPVSFEADPDLIELARASAEQVNPGHTKLGRVASGDQFVCEKAKKEHIISVTQALCTEMEGAAIAHAAYRNQIPFVIIRAISDKADDSAEMDYPTFERAAAKHSANLVANMICKL